MALSVIRHLGRQTSSFMNKLMIISRFVRVGTCTVTLRLHLLENLDITSVKYWESVENSQPGVTKPIVDHLPWPSWYQQQSNF